jgi:hypothetical protein
VRCISSALNVHFINIRACSVDTPFELVKKDINDTFLGFSFNESVLPVPQINTVSFCGQLDTGVVDDLGSALIKVAQIGTIVLIVLALLLLAGHCLLEWYKWRCLRQSLERTRLAWSTDPTVYHVTAVTSTPSLQMTDHNLLTLHATSTHPLLARLANKIAAVCHLTPSQFVHLQFFFHYVFHPPALACFLIGFFGLLSVELQLLALGPVQAKFSQQVSASVSTFSNTIADSMNASMQNQSAVYANSINGQVSTMQADINNGLFGWVNGTTSTLNSTLNTFYTDIQNTVTTLLGGTILDQPVQEFVRCIIGTKVQALENAITFLHDNLNVNLPVINQTVLLLSPAQVNEASQPISEAAVGSNGSNGGVVGSVVNRYVSDLKKERIMFGVFMGLWGVVVFMALCIIFWHSYGKVWLKAYKRKRWQREQHGNVDTAARAWTHDNGSTLSTPFQFTNKTEKALHSFPPMASPVKTGFFAALRKSAADAHGQRSMERTISNSTSKSSSHNTPSWERSNKLMAIGRKAMGREVLVPDKDPEAQSRGTRSDKTEVFEVEIKEEKGLPWWRRLWKRRDSIDSFESDGEPKGRVVLMPEHRRQVPPNLTIETNIIPPQSQRDRYPIIVQDEPQVEEIAHQPLVSAWSISPATRPTPWARPLANTLPLRPKPRPSAALPQSVKSSYGPSFTLSDTTPFKADPPPPGLPIPIHHGFMRPIPQGTPSSPSPPTSPVLHDIWNLAPPPPQANGRPTNHARSSSNVIVDDPFATCFDDEHRVQPDLPTKPANPFADGASGTPRAV